LTYKFFFFRTTTLLMTASLSLPRAIGDFDHASSLCARFQEFTHVWAIDLSLLLDRISGTSYLSA